MHACPADELMTNNGLRRTKDRHALLALFTEGRAWTAAQLHRKVRTADLSTVYRNVNALVAKGVLTETHVHGHEAYFELASLPHHDHRVCTRCDAAECVPCPGNLPQEHRLELIGTCATCA